jgi:hypothetical protein
MAERLGDRETAQADLASTVYASEIFIDNPVTAATQDCYILGEDTMDLSIAFSKIPHVATLENATGGYLNLRELSYSYHQPSIVQFLYCTFLPIF